MSSALAWFKTGRGCAWLVIAGLAVTAVLLAVGADPENPGFILAFVLLLVGGPVVFVGLLLVLFIKPVEDFLDDLRSGPRGRRQSLTPARRLRGGPSRTRTAEERRERLNRRLRQAFVEGAEANSRRRLGRGLTAEEPERVLWRYPGDIAEPSVRDGDLPD